MTDQFDLILEQTFFCALDPSKRKDYVKKTSQLLQDSGKLAGVLFGIKFPFQGPPFGGSLEEYLTYFSSYFKLIKLEPCINSIDARFGNELFIIAQKS